MVIVRKSVRSFDLNWSESLFLMCVAMGELF